MSKNLTIVQQNSQYSRLQIITLCWPIMFLTNSVEAALTGGSWMPGGGVLGVVAASAFSSADMSAGTSAKSGVDR